MQTVDDALPVFKRQVDRCIDMRADGIVVVVLFRVEFVGEVAHTDTEFERQPTVNSWCDGEVDERVEGKHLAQLG